MRSPSIRAMVMRLAIHGTRFIVHPKILGTYSIIGSWFGSHVCARWMLHRGISSLLRGDRWFWLRD